MRHLARRVLVLVTGVAAVLAVACGSDGDEGGLRWDSQTVQASAEGAPFVPTMLNSSLGAGENRVVVALIHRDDGALIQEASMTATFYRLAEDPDAEPEVAEMVASAPLQERRLDLTVTDPATGNEQGVAPRRESKWPIANFERRGGERPADSHEDSITTVYTTTATFDAPGYWGVVLEIDLEGKTYRPRMKFWVLEHTPEPAIGEPAPRTQQKVLADVADAAEVSSQREPQEGMLDQTVAEALETRKPVVVAFVTPAFCQTRFCGPVMEAVVQPAYVEYGDRVEFVHIEPYDLRKARTDGVLEPVPAVQEWGIRSEPFIFVVDAEGIIRAKIEGVTDQAELSEAIEAVLAAGT